MGKQRPHALPKYLTRVSGDKLRVDYRLLPDPVRVLTSQAFGIVSAGDGASATQVVFGTLIAGRRLSSAALIHMEPIGLHDIVTSFDAEFCRSVDSVAQASSGSPVYVSDAQLDGLPLDRVWTARASMARAAVSAHGGQLDFYELTPWTLHMIGSGGKATGGVQAIVTVCLSAANLMALIADMRRRLEELTRSSDTEKMGDSEAQ